MSSSACALGDALKSQDAAHHALECLPVVEDDITAEKDGDGHHFPETPYEA